MLLALAATVLLGGLHGVVMRGPTQPVCRVGVSCSEPAVGAVLVFSRGGRIAARIRVGDGGRYAVRLAAGRYAVRLAAGRYTVGVVPAPRIGAGLRPQAARVEPGVSARVDFMLDTGIR